MRAIEVNKENETKVSLILEEYKKCDYTFATMFPQQEEFISITSSLRGKLDGCIINLYTEKLGVVKLVVNDTRITGILKDFLESASLVVTNAIFCKKLMLVFDVKLNILHDIRSMGYVKFERMVYIEDMCKLLEIPYVRGSEESIFAYISGVFNKIIDITTSDRYKLLFALIEPLTYSEYFGVMNDIDVDKLNKYKDALVTKYKQCESENIAKYKINFDSQKALKSLLSEVSGMEIKSANRKDMLSYTSSDNADFAELAERVIYTRRLQKQVREISVNLSSMHYTIYNNYRLKQKFCISDRLPSLRHLDVIHTNEKKQYYVLVSGGQIEYRVVEILMNGLDITEDYHLHVASIVYDKPIAEITIQERRKAKIYNFIRTVKFFKMKNYLFDVNKEFTHEEFQLFLDKAPMFDDSDNKSLFIEQLIMKKIAKFGKLMSSETVGTKPSIILNSMEFRDFVFKVDNSVNPYRAMKLLADIFDTTEDVGVRLFNTFRVANNYIDFALDGEVVKDLSYSDIIEGYNNITQEKVRNIVNEIYKK